jgi:prepilin-type N-terminal cleavage/methylation domain-containing protein
MKNRNFRTLKGLRQRQAGYTLVELSISISIIALLLVGSITGVQSLLAANKVNRTVAQTTVTTANIARVITAIASNDAVNINTPNLIKLGVWDQTGLKTTAGVTTSVNPFGGTIQVAPNVAAVGTFVAGKGFWYRLSNIPESSCTSLATSFYSTSPGIWINKTPATTTADAAKTPPAGNAYRTPGVDDSVGQLTTACAAAPGGSGLVEIALFIPA